MKKLLLVISLILTLWVNIGVAEEVVPHYKIAIKNSAPFAYTEGGEWQGVSVDLVKRLAERVGFTYSFVGAPDITSLISRAENAEVDFSIGAISMSEAREMKVDFSHPFFTTTQGILISENGNDLLILIGEMSIWVVYLVIYLLIAGWLAAKIDPKDSINTTEIGTWFVWVTTTTVGYGDFAPRCLRTRLFAGMVMFISLFGVSAFTAKMASILTVERLSDNIVTLADLNNSRVMAIRGTTTDYLLNLLEVKHDYVKTPQKGVEAVTSGKVKAFVYDKAMLDYLALKEDNTSLIVHPVNRGLERYAIAFPPGSKLRESINVAILGIIDSPEWKQLITLYFGN